MHLSCWKLLGGIICGQDELGCCTSKRCQDGLVELFKPALVKLAKVRLSSVERVANLPLHDALAKASVVCSNFLGDLTAAQVAPAPSGQPRISETRCDLKPQLCRGLARTGGI